MNDTMTPPVGFGWRKDRPDRRDRLLFAAVPNVDALPDRVDNSRYLPEVMDQSVTGSCVGFSGAAMAYATMKVNIERGLRDGRARAFVPSPVFLYREARVLGGYVEEDMGAEIRLAWKAANKVGLPPMSNIPPRFSKDDLADQSTAIFPENSIWRKPSAPSHFADAERRQAVSYFRLENLADLLKCIADGYCAQIGFSVFRSLYDWAGNPHYHVPDPVQGERYLGGHAVVAFGYDKPNRRVFCQNSWGKDAHQGKPSFTLSFKNLEQHSGDNWTVQAFEGGRVKL